VDPSDPAAVAVALQRRLGGGTLVYQESPQPICWGWETHTYQLQFRAGPNLPAPLAGPLILRIYSNANGVPRACREFAVQRRLCALGFPAPKPLLLQRNCALFGAPFVLMERIPGETVCHRILSHPWELFTLAGRMAELHARLHRLSTESSPTAGTGFLRRWLDELSRLIATYGLRDLKPGLDWLWLHRPTPWPRAVAIHLDWHPLNLIRRYDGQLWAVDWSEADVGDPHADVATALVLLRCAPTAYRNEWEKLGVLLGRRWIARRYGRVYGKLMSLNAERLAYYRAWAILRRLAYYGRWLTGGPASTGSKEAVLHYLHRDHLDDLIRSFRHETGVSIQL